MESRYVVGWKRWVAVMLLTACVALPMIGCGPSLPGTITLVKTVVEEPVVGMKLFQDKWMYVIDENGKLRAYDLSNPEEPKRLPQVDAFKDEAYQMGFEVSNQWLVVVGKSGKIVLFDLRDPSTPQPVWGQGTVLQLKGSGPMFIRTDSPIMYLTPSSGGAILRVDLASLGSNTTDQAALDGASKMIPGGGGGGIIMPYDQSNAGIRIYVGNRSSGKLDIWNIEDVEKGTATAPVKSIDIKAGTGIKDVFLYQEQAPVNKGWLVTVSDSGDVEYLDMGRNYTQTDEPASVGSASVPGFFGIDMGQKVILTDQLSVYDFNEELTSPIEYAKPELAATVILRSIVVYKGYVYSAEAGGLRLYKFGPASN